MLTNIVAEGVVEGMHAGASAPVWRDGCAERHEPLLLRSAAGCKQQHCALPLEDRPVGVTQLQRGLPQPPGLALKRLCQDGQPGQEHLAFSPEYRIQAALTGTLYGTILLALSCLSQHA